MSTAAIEAARARQPVSLRRPTRTIPFDQGGCPRCGHPMYETAPSVYFCPCEDCHTGGVVVRERTILKKGA